MQILQFKLGGEYDYNVTFETETEKRKIQTNDHPQGNLLEAVASVVVAATKYFRLENIMAAFKQITYSYPSNGPHGFVLEFTIKTKENINVKHTLKSERLDLKPDDTVSDNKEFQAHITESNDLIKKVVDLREEIQKYATGARMQKDLPFDEDDDEPDEQGLFEGGE